MTNEAISPLRQRMIEDMTVRRFTAKTQSDYIRSVRNFAVFLGRSPDTATAEDLRRFQLHLTETRIRPPTINGTVSALRFFFTVTLGRADVARSLTFVAESARDLRQAAPWLRKMSATSGAMGNWLAPLSEHGPEDGGPGTR
jgi:integrase/recombinase XerD